MADLFEQFTAEVRTGGWEDAKVKFLRALDHVRGSLNDALEDLKRTYNELHTLSYGKTKGLPETAHLESIKDAKKLAKKRCKFMEELITLGEKAFARIGKLEDITRRTDWSVSRVSPEKREPGGERHFRKAIKYIWHTWDELKDFKMGGNKYFLSKIHFNKGVAKAYKELYNELANIDISE